MAKFTTQVPGMQSVKSLGSSLHVDNPMKKNIKVTNRAERGHLKGKPITFTYNSERFPEGADIDDESTWLNPGESMTVDREVILGTFGLILFHKEKSEAGKLVFDPADKEFIINNFGGWQYNPVPSTGQTSPIIGQRIVGHPRKLPDLVLQQLDAKGNPFGEPVAIFEVLTNGVTINKVLPGSAEVYYED